jgi:hypothetical protein
VRKQPATLSLTPVVLTRAGRKARVAGAKPAVAAEGAR